MNNKPQSSVLQEKYQQQKHKKQQRNFYKGMKKTGENSIILYLAKWCYYMNYSMKHFRKIAITKNIKTLWRGLIMSTNTN